MAKKGRLLLALDAHKGRDYAAEKRMKQVKAAEKRKRQKQQSLKQADDANSDENRPEEQDQPPAEPMVNLADKDFASFSADEDDDGEENGVLLEAEIQQSGLHTQPSPSHSDSESNHDADVPFSDLSEEDRTDIVPHHRQTINNGPAIIASTKSVTIAKPEMPFSAHNSLVSLLPALATSVPDPNDDLTRELEFYRIAQDAAVSARELLLEAGIPFSRPNDYFAEMVKTDEHMGKVRKKMYDEAAAKKASSEAKAQRQAKKFGKQVQRAKEEERARTRRETLDKIKDLKRKRKGQDTGLINEPDELFESIDVEAPPVKDRSGRERGPRGGGHNPKRQKRDARYGFGGKKRFGKSGDAVSTADTSGFSAGRMKGKRGVTKKQRLGKSRRAAAANG